MSHYSDPSPFVKPKPTPEVEEYFTAFTLVFGDQLLDYDWHKTAFLMRTWEHKPKFLQQLLRAYKEVSLAPSGTTQDIWFFEELAARYRTWVFDQRSNRSGP